MRDAEFEWEIICKYGWTILEKICGKICSGNITILQLRSINAKRAEMSKVCAAAALPLLSKSRKDKHIRTAPSGIPSFGIIQDCLDMRLKEFDYFVNYRDQLFNFLQLTAELQLTGT